MTYDHGDETPTEVAGIEFPGRADRHFLLDLPHVIGHGIGHREVAGEKTDDYAVRVYVDQKLPPDELGFHERIPPYVGDGILTDVIESKPIEIDEFAEADNNYLGPAVTTRDDEIRPVAGGTKIAPGTSSFGSIGGTFWDTAANTPVALTSAHVLGNLGATESEMIGTDAYQPTGSSSNFHIGTVSKSSNTANESERSDITFVDITSSNSGTSPTASTRAYCLNEIIGVESPEVDVRYTRSGRMTGIASGQCLTVDETRTIAGEDQNYTFHDLFTYDVGSTGGDSGGLVGYVTPDASIACVGLHIAGPSNDHLSIGTPLAKASTDSGLDPVEPLQNHTDHNTVTDAIPEPDDDFSGNSFLEAHPRRIYYSTEDRYVLNLLVVNTGYADGSTTWNLERANGEHLYSTTFDVNAEWMDIRQFYLDASFQGDRLRAYTDDQANQFDDLSRFEFTVQNESSQSGYAESDFGDPPSDPRGQDSDPSGPDLDPLDPVDPSPYEHTIVIRNVNENETFGFNVWIDVPNNVDDFEEQFGNDYGEYEGQNFEPETYNSALEKTSLTNQTEYVMGYGTVSNADDSDQTTWSRAAARFNGPIAAIEPNPDGVTSGTGQIEVDGEVVDPADYPNEPDAGPGTDPDALVTMHGELEDLAGYPSLYTQFLIREQSDGTQN